MCPHGTNVAICATLLLSRQMQHSSTTPSMFVGAEGVPGSIGSSISHSNCVGSLSKRVGSCSTLDEKMASCIRRMKMRLCINDAARVARALSNSVKLSALSTNTIESRMWPAPSWNIQPSAPSPASFCSGYGISCVSCGLSTTTSISASSDAALAAKYTVLLAAKYGRSSPRSTDAVGVGHACA